MRPVSRNPDEERTISKRRDLLGRYLVGRDLLAHRYSDLVARLLLIAAAIVPVLLVLVYLQAERHDEQRARLAEDALQQARVVSIDMASIVEAARQLSLAISQFRAVRMFDPACRDNVTTLDRVLDNYDTISVADEDGRLICASTGPAPGTGLPAAPLFLTPAQQAQNAQALASGQFETGLYRPAEGGLAPVLMFSLPFVGETRRRGVVNVGLSLSWLDAHFQNFRRPPDSFIEIADRAGTTLVAVPAGQGRVGDRLPERPADDISPRHIGDDAIERLMTTLAPDPSDGGLRFRIGLSLPRLMAPIDRVAMRGYALMVLGVMVSALMAWLAGRRFVQRPKMSLLAAAQAWSNGDLTARVTMSGQGSDEFAVVTEAFNAMAANLHRQQTGREDLQATLEARVAARTAELVLSRDRLQVAMGEQAKSEASLRQAQKMQAVGQLAGGIAHDFNNLLTAIMGALELLRRRAAPDDARSQRLLDTALHAADRGGRLTSQLLAFSRRQRLLPVPTDLNAVIDGMIGLLSTTLGDGVRVQHDAGAGLWLALVDPHQVESAVLNLALNSRDAMDRGGVLRIATSNTRVSTQAAAQAEPIAQADRIAVSEPAPPGDYVMIQISDTGHGMPPDVLARVFEPFFTTKETGRGSGLGLSQVHGLAAQSGGEIRVDSTPGLGTVVSLLLPRASQPAEASLLPGVARGAPMRRMRVLVVDDDFDVRSLTGDMLDELGHVPVLAHDGASALDALQAEAPMDLLLADYAMPGMTGVMLIDRAAQLWPQMQAILVTGHADVDAPSLAGGHRVLRKPFSLAVLAQSIDEAAMADATTRLKPPSAERLQNPAAERLETPAAERLQTTNDSPSSVTSTVSPVSSR